MAPCRLRKTRTVLLFIVAVLSLLIACNTADEEAGPRGALSETATAGPTATPPTVVAVSPSPGSFPSLLPPDASQVQVIITKDVYEVGEDIPYTIINHSDRPIYYRFPPLVVQWVDNTEVVLITNPTDVWPPIKEIEPNESVNGVWDQTFHPYGKADPEVQGHRYQLRFWYAVNKEDVDMPYRASSDVFAID